jgi:hypothetical protein
MESRAETENKVSLLKEKIQMLKKELREQCSKLDHPRKRTVTNTDVGSFGRTFISSRWVCEDCGETGGFKSEEAPPEC